MANSKTTEKAAEKSESRYSAADLIAAARSRFNTSPEVVSTALKLAGKKDATMSEAEKIIQEFLKRRVK